MNKMKIEDTGVPYIFIRNEKINYRQKLIEQLDYSIP
jgi:hypothetical protein